jgi:hypothetical protein
MADAAKQRAAAEELHPGGPSSRSAKPHTRSSGQGHVVMQLWERAPLQQRFVVLCYEPAPLSTNQALPCVSPSRRCRTRAVVAHQAVPSAMTAGVLSKAAGRPAPSGCLQVLTHTSIRWCAGDHVEWGAPVPGRRKASGEVVVSFRTASNQCRHLHCTCTEVSAGAC